MNASSVPSQLSQPGQAGCDGQISAPADLEIVAELGRGAQTVVYRVRRGTDEYALKMLRSSTGDEAALAQFRREAAMLACVRHPGIGSVHDVGSVDGRPYLVMDLISGQRLSDLIALGPLDEERVVSIGREVADALAAAHRAGLVHRDVKPDNILITPDGSARVIDFGLAARSTDGHSGAIAGTLTYTAPEQSGMLKRPVDGRADLYALGAVLLECATGAPPFAAGDVGELLRMHVATPAPDARSRRPDLSPALAAIIAKLLAKDPDDRYQSGTGLAADLGAWPVTELVPGQRDTPAGVGHDPPLVGRDATLNGILDGWNRARRGSGGLALIAGAPGFGKSRLAREVASRARGDGHVVLQVECARDDSVPMAPLRAAIDQYLLAVQRLPAEERAAAIRQVVSAAGPAAALLRRLSPGLARLLDAPDLDQERQDQVTAAVATFLVELARSLGGLLLYVDDVQWLDEPSRRVLAELATELPTTPLFVLATARNDEASVPVLHGLRAALGTAVTVSVTLPALDESATRRLVAEVTGGMDVAGDLADLLTVRSAGSPFMVLEYLNAMIDAGLVRPCWGTWLVDTERLTDLDLPEDAADLVVKRLDALDARHRRVLAAAASMPGRFSAGMVAQLCQLEHGEALEIAEAAAAQRLVERGADGDYTFLHERIRSALLADLDAPTLRGMHGRIAVLIERAGPTQPEQVYALAQHVMGAGPDQPIERVVRACTAAGELALADQAPARAVEYLQYADAAAAAAGHDLDGPFLQNLGLAHQRAGRSPEALATLKRALDATTDRLDRATILHLIARCNENAWQPNDVLTAVHRGLAEVGRPLPRTAVGRIAMALWLFVLSLVISSTGLERGTVRGAKRDRHSLIASLYASGADAAARALQPLNTLTFLLMQRYYIVRVGACPAAARSSSGLAMLAHAVRLHRTGERIFERAVATGVALGDPRSVAEVHWMDGIGRYGNGVDLGGKLRTTMEQHGRWLETNLYLEGITQICWNHLMRGELGEAAAWQRRGAARVAAGVALTDGHPFLGVAPAILAMQGQFAEASTQLHRLRAAIVDREPYVRLNFLPPAALTAVEQCDLESMVDEVATALATVDPASMKIMTHFQDIVVYRAYGLVELARTAPAERRAERFSAAYTGVNALGKAATRPLTRAHHAVLTAALEHAAGNDEAALARLAKADRLLRRVDAPLVAFEAALVRARSLTHTGEQQRQARYALDIASDHGWTHRARRIKSEFSINVSGATNTHHTRTGTRGGTHNPGADSATAGIFRQRLSALEQVSQAASRVLDPDQLARIALDETVRILAAERAFLFLCDPQTGAVLPHLGRDGAGNDLQQLTGYASTLVDAVRASRTPLVITGTEDGAALASQSVVVHGLRSIMAAPLLLDDRLLGVVYLDSRVAKGIFTADDVGILAAITNHIAIAMETARAAQLEVAVATANHQRALAETLRDAMARLSGTLEPAEVLDRLLTATAELLTADLACLVVTETDGSAVRVHGVHGADDEADEKLNGARISIDTDPQLVELLAADGTVGSPHTAAPASLEWVLQRCGSWIAVPLRVRDERIGLLLLATRPERAYDDAQSHTASALVSQGMIAYENARLFHQVRQLATVDGLTGVVNRRHFYHLATQQLAEADTSGAPLAALMIDIDHFKRINDTHGHQIGDQVIRTVAERLQAHGRDGDLIGRYGGEEFAALLPVSAARAEATADRLRHAICDTPVQTDVGPLPVTISVGVAVRTPDDRDVDAVLARADQCLYRAKQAGRNRVVLSSD